MKFIYVCLISVGLSAAANTESRYCGIIVGIMAKPNYAAIKFGSVIRPPESISDSDQYMHHLNLADDVSGRMLGLLDRARFNKEKVCFSIESKFPFKMTGIEVGSDLVDAKR